MTESDYFRVRAAFKDKFDKFGKVGDLEKYVGRPIVEKSVGDIFGIFYWQCYNELEGRTIALRVQHYFHHIDVPAIVKLEGWAENGFKQTMDRLISNTLD